MIHQQIPIQVEGSVPGTYMTIYMHDYTDRISIDRRPTVLILPGGAYEYKSPREGEPIALELLRMGCNAAVLEYSTAPTAFPVALREVGAAIELLHLNAETWHIDEERVLVMGFSAGGHLAASYACYWNRPEVAQDASVQTVYAPAGLILGYPVITSDENHSHQGSIHNLLLGRYGDPEAMEMIRLEHQVGPQVPRTFIWNTVTDNAVPAENSVMFVQALMQAGVSVEFHMYDRGEHGLALATEQTAEPGRARSQHECASWINLLETWLGNQ